MGDPDLVIKKMKTIVYRNNGVNLNSEVLGGYLKQQHNTIIQRLTCMFVHSFNKLTIVMRVHKII